VDLWTDHGVLPYRTLVNTYKHLSSHPRQWRLFYYLSNSRANEIFANQHTRIMCGKPIKKRIESFNPDVVVSVHPTMNYTPQVQTQKISKELGKHIPFYTVVTDLGSGHSMWFSRNVDKLYVASERLRKIAKRRAKAPEEKIFMAGLPIRHDFAVQAENMGDRTTEAGKAYQRTMRDSLGVDRDKHLVLVMGGGEGVGSLESIVDELYTEFYKQGVDATICVVCGRNEKLKKTLETRDWDAVAKAEKKPRKHRRLLNYFHRVRRSRKIDEAIKKVEELEELPHAKGKVDVVGLGFVTNMAEYMAASDVLVTKAGPGTIAEAAAVGLPVFLTRYVGFFKFAALFDNIYIILTITFLFAVFCQAKRREMSTSS
jgi:1,2-diacylglycerol 3-beta-galactosyltransferase